MKQCWPRAGSRTTPEVANTKLDAIDHEVPPVQSHLVGALVGRVRDERMSLEVSLTPGPALSNTCERNILAGSV